MTIKTHLLPLQIRVIMKRMLRIHILTPSPERICSGSRFMYVLYHFQNVEHTISMKIETDDMEIL